MNIRTCCIGLIILIVVKLHAGENDWSRFRGQNGSGISEVTTVPVQWTEKDYNWKIKLPGLGHSSPVVLGHRIFVTSGETGTAARIVMCLDTDMGRVLWQREYKFKPFILNRENSYTTATPAADADGVVVNWTTPEEVILLVLDNEGREVWRRDLGPFVGIHGSGSSPVIVDDLVIYNNDQEDPASLPAFVYARPGAPKSAGKSSLIALDRRTGKTRWQLDRRSNQASYVTPCVYRTANGRPEIILASTAHGVTGVDAVTGKVEWELGGIFKERCVGSPVIASDLICAGEGKGSTGLRIVAVRAGKVPKLAYEVLKPVPLVPTPLVKDGRLFLWADDGNVTCVRAETGELIWREHVSGMFYSSPVCVNNRLYSVTKNGDVVVIAAADKFELLGRVPLGEKCFASPAVAGGVIYFRTFTQLFSLGGKRSLRSL
ncbi:MAG: PQQ-binding-like beta-propeller repeat protein [Kiritimatiellae bacterium]|nr:PQQ-binding-like beta-propeller repeat protein [Kiritimatiellia bacterium]MDD5522928.1 PQQ-binding-like beta-propeller repeat protein [Kiritimatiellia bacterium]